MRALTRYTAPHTRCFETAALRQAPRLRRLRGRVELRLGEQNLVRRIPEKLAYLTGELHREVEVIPHVDYLVVGESAQMPRREADRSELRFTMPRWDEEHKPGGLLIRHVLREPLQPHSDIVVHPPDLIVGVRVFSEVDKAAFRQLSSCKLLDDLFGALFVGENCVIHAQPRLQSSRHRRDEGALHLTSASTSRRRPPRYQTHLPSPSQIRRNRTSYRSRANRRP